MDLVQSMREFSVNGSKQRLPAMPAPRFLVYGDCLRRIDTVLLLYSELGVVLKFGMVRRR